MPHSGGPRTGGAMAHWTDDFFTGYWSAMQRAAPMTDVAAGGGAGLPTCRAEMVASRSSWRGPDAGSWV